MSLLELMIVIVLIAVALGPVIFSSRASIGKAAFDSRRSLAVNLITRMTERAAGLPFDTLRTLTDGGLDPETDPLLTADAFPTRLRDLVQDYSRRVTFEEKVPGKVGVLKVELRWYASARAEQSRLVAARVIVNRSRSVIR